MSEINEQIARKRLCLEIGEIDFATNTELYHAVSDFISSLRQQLSQREEEIEKLKDGATATVKEQMRVLKFLDELATKGGYIVCSSLASETEIAIAQTNDRMLIINSIGFIRRPDAATLPEILNLTEENRKLREEIKFVATSNQKVIANLENEIMGLQEQLAKKGE